MILIRAKIKTAGKKRRIITAESSLGRDLLKEQRGC